MVDWSIILCANNHKTGNGTGTGRRTVTARPRVEAFRARTISLIDDGRIRPTSNNVNSIAGLLEGKVL